VLYIRETYRIKAAPLNQLQNEPQSRKWQSEWCAWASADR